MTSTRRLLALIFLSLTLAGCVVAGPPAGPTGAAATIIPCDAATKMPDGSLLPGFTSAYHCQLENSSFNASCMITDNTPSYPCTRDEQVRETALSESSETVFIERQYTGYAGCWHATTWAQTSLKVCRKSSGAVTTLAEDVLGSLTPSPDGVWLAFVAAEPGSHRMHPHLFRVRTDGSGLQRLDTEKLPYPVVGMTLKGWSADGAWIDVSLWDGTQSGHYEVRIKADPSQRRPLTPTGRPAG